MLSGDVERARVRATGALATLCLLGWGWFVATGTSAAETWYIYTVDSANVGYYSSLTLDSYGHPHISYQDQTIPAASALKYAAWTGTSWTVQTVHQGTCASHAVDTSIAVDGSDHAHISYKYG